MALISAFDRNSKKLEYERDPPHPGARQRKEFHSPQQNEFGQNDKNCFSLRMPFKPEYLLQLMHLVRRARRCDGGRGA
jgi:hypothetical protein